jgi:gliding motility-associated-like protein
MVNPIVTHVTCYGAHNGSINLNLTGGIAPVALTWSDGSPSGLIRNNLGPGTYTATISDGTPCYIVSTFTIIEPQPIALSANITNAFDCTNAASGAIDLVPAGGTPPYTYSWSNGANVEDLTYLTSGNYLVTVTDSNGCTKTGQYTIVRQAPIAIAVATQTNFDCAAHTVTQNYVAQVSGGIPPYQLQWSSGTVSGANNEIMHSDINGTVVLTVTDSNGCSDTYTVSVDNPVIGYSSFDTSSYGYTTYGIYAIGDPIQFQSTVTGDYVSVSWDFGDGTFSTELNPSHIYAIPKDYIVTQTVTYPFGCVYVQTISLIIEKGYVLVVPTAFTPNTDNVNDTYRPVTKALKKVHLDVYDTWGSLIYTEIGDVLVGWDGKIKGFYAENGNYYSKVSAETFYGTIVNENQTFVLIK